MKPEYHPRALTVLILSVAVITHVSRGQSVQVTIPPTTPLSVESDKHVPMKVGEPIEGHLLYPIYADNVLAIPDGSLVRGTVVGLRSNHGRRVRSRLRGDFTPFHIPIIRFDQLVLSDGTIHSIEVPAATDGAPVLRLSAPAARPKGSLISREIALAKQRVKAEAAVFTAPGRTDRLVQFLYQQLPYHPERIEKGTSWTVELSQPLNTGMKAKPPDDREVSKNTPQNPVIHKRAKEADKKESGISKPSAQVGPPEEEKTWQLHAYLKQTISSADAYPNQTFEASIAEPVLNEDHTLAVPEGALLVGTITQAKPARSFGRDGKLRFSFRELKLPDGFSQQVQGTLAGVDSNKSQDLQLDSEGAVQPKPGNRVIVPLILTLLASRGLDEDGGQLGNSTVAANGFGLVGRVVGMAASSRNVATGIGFYGAALAFYDRWLARGHDVVFTKNTRIEVATTPNRSKVIRPNLK